jgi:fructose-1,6-bisphosphatase/inositol monophosphatase family enzyme
MEELLAQVTAVVRQAGEALLTAYAETARPAGKADMHRAGTRLEELADRVLKPGLAEIRPDARWANEDEETTALPPGEFWAVDPVEGAVNVDAYWQYECDLIGVAAGVLLVTEAGGVVTNLDGKPWQPGDLDILAAAPGVHRELLSVLNPSKEN